jgi:hypothetical protein
MREMGNHWTIVGKYCGGEKGAAGEPAGLVVVDQRAPACYNGDSLVIVMAPPWWVIRRGRRRRVKSATLAAMTFGKIGPQVVQHRNEPELAGQRNSPMRFSSAGVVGQRAPKQRAQRGPLRRL